MQGCNVWNIDTGAGFYGKLSCLDIDTKAFFQSDKILDLYPNEKGRN
jgi:serine/threonine protein phosphatase 1